MFRSKNERGELMIESMIIVILTMFLLLWILAVGFIYYQRNLVTTITNDAAAKIAATYNNVDSDIVMGYISTEDMVERPLYRNFNNGALKDANETKAEAYVRYMIKRTNFLGTIADPENDIIVTMDLVMDSAVRKHIVVKTQCTFKTPFGEALELFGMDGDISYEATGRADCTDIADYISTTDFAARIAGGKVVKSKVLDCLNSLIKVFNKVFG